MFRKSADWIDTLANNELARRVAIADETGRRIHMLDSISADHPYGRLELVEEVARALTLGTDSQSEREGWKGNDDARRAREALVQGVQVVAAYRYARTHGISTAVPPPPDFVAQAEFRSFESGKLASWQALPREVGPFFVDSLVGTAGPLSGIDPALARPPSATIEIFRPRWYKDAALWRHDPVPSDFADSLIETSPELTGVLGIGGLVPWLENRNSIEVAKNLAGRWAGDRWALWQFPDGLPALLLETRWQDKDAALKFREALPDRRGMIPFHEAGSRVVRLLRSDSPAAIDRLTSAVIGAAH